MKLRFTSRANRHIDRIHEYISQRNPDAATRVIGRIRQTAEALGDSPRMGHQGLLTNTREMNVRGLPYVIVYRVDDDDTVVVLAVFHGAQDREHSAE
jgi:addiction module RelE/StbE family toxin